MRFEIVFGNKNSILTMQCVKITPVKESKCSSWFL